MTQHNTAQKPVSLIVCVVYYYLYVFKFTVKCQISLILRNSIKIVVIILHMFMNV